MVSAVKRGFVDVGAGQIHHRRLAGGDGTPLVMFHQASGSSRMMTPLMPALAEARPVYAIDLPGNGDSDALAGDPDIAAFAAAVSEAIDALGLERFALYGFHAGASVALEVAVASPERTAALILDSLGLYPPEEGEAMARRSPPGIVKDPHGTHLLKIFHYVRDTYLFWPWYDTSPAGARGIGLPPLDEMHDKAVEVIKAMDSYEQLYRAAFRHVKEPLLARVTAPTLVTAGRSNSQAVHVPTIAGLVPGGEQLITGGVYSPQAAAATARALAAWLDGKT
jgi:pimeloyl-ACP methyl ester carboxylesterase